jgi:hypothetical protein
MARLYALQKADMRAMEKQGVRENPIRRNTYALQGGANPTEPLEFGLASRRAMEIQSNRTNPRRKGATPTMGVSEVRGGFKINPTFGLMGNLVDAIQGKGDATSGGRSYTISGALKDAISKKGGRAVPSSGMSQFRGGSNGVIVGSGHGSDSDSGSDSDYEGCGRETEIMARESASRPAIRSGLSDQHSLEAKEMGRHLGTHLVGVRGGAFYDLFKKGMMEAGHDSASMSKQTGMPDPNPPPAMPPSATGGAMFYRLTDMADDALKRHAELTTRRFGRTRKGGAFKDFDFSKYTPKKDDGARAAVIRPEDIRRHQEATAERMETIRRGRDRLGMPKVISEADRRELADYDRRNSNSSGKFDFTKLKKDFGASGGYLSGPYEGMGMLGTDGHGQRRGKGKLTIIHGGKSLLGDIGSYIGRQMEKPNSMIGSMARGVRDNAIPLLNVLTTDYTKKKGKGAVGEIRMMDGDAPSGSIGDLLNRKKITMMMGKGRRAPAGPSDGRRARAAIVKQVMAEQGLSMPQASKYVKDNGLY